MLTESFPFADIPPDDPATADTDAEGIPSTGSNPPTATIIAVVVAGILVLILILVFPIVLIFYLQARMRRMDKMATSSEAPSNIADKCDDLKGHSPPNATNNGSTLSEKEDSEQMGEEERYQSLNARERRSRERSLSRRLSLQQEVSAQPPKVTMAQSQTEMVVSPEHAPSPLHS
jgi:flagellar biosynthesis/type III secretory pathway M-ring protein FliF/YscJ